MILTPDEAKSRIAKLNFDRATAVQAANAQLAPVEAQLRELTEQKAVIVGNANLAVGRIEGEIKLLKDLFPEAEAEAPARPTAVPDPGN